MSGINISELVITHNANTKSFERGEACYRRGYVQSITQRGDEIQAEVQGSEDNSYRVTIGFNSDGLTAFCTCPYNYDGWCKHIVATALTCARQESSIEKRPSLAQLLDRLNHVQTQRLVQELVEEHPELIDEIDGYVNAIVAPAPTQEKQPSRQITVNTKQIKAEVRHILREAGRYLEDGYEEDPVTQEVQALIQQAVLARTNAFQANPSFADYRIIEDLAENSWVDVKAELLEILRNLSRYIGLTGEKVDIFLHENLIDDAIACVNDTSSYHNDIVHRVMSAALSTRPEWVIENSRRRAESIMNAGKAEYYHHAAEWLKKTRAAYFASSNQAEWKKYYNELLSVHSRKSKLMGLLKQKGLGY